MDKKEGKQRTTEHWRQGLRWTVRLGHSQRKGGRGRMGERGRETAPFVRAGDVPLHTTHAMHAPACPRQQCRIAEPHMALACPAHALAGEQGSGGGEGQ